MQGMEELSAVFLEGDIRQELERLQAVKAEALATIELLTTMPDEFEQPCMVPLTRVAFMPGKIVHTNEVLTDIGQGYHVWRSAKQTREYLKRQIETVEGKMRALEESLGPEFEYGLHEQEEGEEQASEAGPAKQQQQQPQQAAAPALVSSQQKKEEAGARPAGQPQPSKPSKPSKPRKKVSFADDEVKPFSHQEPPSQVREQHKPAAPEVKTAEEEEEEQGDVGFVPMNFMDIREYVDDDDNPISSEVIDLAKQFAESKERLKEIRAKATEESAKNTEKAEKLTNVLSQMEDRLTEEEESYKKFTGADPAHEDFIRELARTSAAAAAREQSDASVTDDLLDALESLERQEHEHNRQQERDRTELSSAGWKKGFLGSKPANAKPAPTPAAAAASAQATVAPKSILKKAGEPGKPAAVQEKGVAERKAVPVPQPQTTQKTPIRSVVGEIKESYQPPAASQAAAAPASEQEQPAPRVSKFKQQRMVSKGT